MVLHEVADVPHTPAELLANVAAGFGELDGDKDLPRRTGPGPGYVAEVVDDVGMVAGPVRGQARSVTGGAWGGQSRKHHDRIFGTTWSTIGAVSPTGVLGAGSWATTVQLPA